MYGVYEINSIFIMVVIVKEVLIFVCRVEWGLCM